MFGLRDNTPRVFGAGADYAPTDVATFGVSYSFEEYKALRDRARPVRRTVHRSVARLATIRATARIPCS